MEPATPVESRNLKDIGQSWAHFRLIIPRAEAAMVKSLQLFGQISPLVCVKTPEGLEVVDGFKRLRAGLQLQWKAMQTILLETTERACKAGIIRLNRIARSITDLEEAMILHSLYREDSLPQVEIAALLGRDKSWVSRRISLIERLHEEVKRHLQLGLICVSVGRELAKLPRGNQPGVLKKVIEHRLGKREVEKLVRVLLAAPSSSYSAILFNLHEVLQPEHPSPVTSRRSFFRTLSTLTDLYQSLVSGPMLDFPPESEEEESLLRLAVTTSGDLTDRLKDLLNDSSTEVF